MLFLDNLKANVEKVQFEIHLQKNDKKKFYLEEKNYHSNLLKEIEKNRIKEEYYEEEEKDLIHKDIKIYKEEEKRYEEEKNYVEDYEEEDCEEEDYEEEKNEGIYEEKQFEENQSQEKKHKEENREKHLKLKILENPNSIIYLNIHLFISSRKKFF